MDGKSSSFLWDRLLCRERKWRLQAPRWLIFDLWILNATTLKCKIFSAAAWCLNSKFKEHLQFQITWTWIFNWKKKKSTCIVERKPLQNRKPFCLHTCHAWARESKQEPGRFAKAEQLYIGKDWRMFLQELWGQATQGPLGHAQTLCCNRDHVESPLTWRETDRLKIEWLEIIYHDLSNSFYSERWNLLKSFPPVYQEMIYIEQKSL